MKGTLLHRLPVRDERGQSPFLVVVLFTLVMEHRRGVWQRRFWKHMVCDEIDLETHFEQLCFRRLGAVDLKTF